MRKYLMIGVAALLLVACNEKPARRGAAPQQQATEKAAVKGVDYKAPEYLSTDLAMQELGGQVSQMAYGTVECDALGNLAGEFDPEQALYYEFDKQGRYTKAYAFLDDESGPKLVRDEQGRVKHIERAVPGMDFTYVDAFTYNADGTIASESVQGGDMGSKTEYHYTDGVLTSAEASENGEGSTYKARAEYKVMEVDDHGNWIRRLMTMTSQEGVAYGMEMRVIEYYN